jgi:hypothetical protein
MRAGRAHYLWTWDRVPTSNTNVPEKAGTHHVAYTPVPLFPSALTQNVLFLPFRLVKSCSPFKLQFIATS